MRRVKTFVAISFLFSALSLQLFAQRVRVGGEVLVEKQLSLLTGKNVGVICNHTSVLPNGIHLVDTLIKLRIHVTALFSPEHGIRGSVSAGTTVGDTIDRQTGIPIFSLYGKWHKPTPEMLKNVDILLFDLQDVGARFYTYASTMALAMEAAAENRKKFIVLDRPDPINGIDVEGPVLDTALRSFVGMFPIPIRHGLTLGELAKMIVGENWIHESSKLDLIVIPMDGWKRSMWYDETGLPWIPPSPNMKTLQTAAVYPATCMFEATNVSEGRGTEKPFEYIGAPWINGKQLADTLNKMKLPGVKFESIQFIPKSDSISAPNLKYRDTLCGGIFINVQNRKILSPVQTGIDIFRCIVNLYSDSLKLYEKAFNRLAGTTQIRLSLTGIDTNASSSSTRGSLLKFSAMRNKYMLYRTE